MSKYIFIDESTTINDSRIIFGAIVIDGSLIDSYRKVIDKVRTEILHDPILSQSYKIESLNKSFHYAQDHRVIKNIFLETITPFSFESLIFLESENGNDNFKDKVSSRCLYIYRFVTKRYKTSDIYFIYEKTDALKGFQVDGKLNFTQKDKLEEPLLSIIDYIIGIFRKLYDEKAQNKNISQEYKTDFYRFHNKIRFIKDSKIKKPFTRRNPFLLDSIQ